MAEATTTPEHDRLGQAIRSAISDVGARVGVAAALVIVVVPWLVTFVLSLLPGAFLAQSLGVSLGPGVDMTVGAKLAASFFAPWAVRVEATSTELSVNERALSVASSLILVLVIIGVGFAVTRYVPTLRGRVTALVTATVTVAAVVGVTSAFVRYVVGDSGETIKISHASQTFVWIPLLWMLLVGVFAFGVVAMLYPPLRIAARSAALIFVFATLFTAVAFTVAIVAWQPTNSNGKSYASDDASRVLGHWGAAAGGAVYPLAFGAKAHLESNILSPFQSGSGATDENIRLPELDRYMQRHDKATVVGYASTAGTLFHVLLLLGAFALVALVVFVAIRAVRILGAPRALDGLRLGLLVGLVTSLFLSALKWLTAAWYDARFEDGSLKIRWAVDAWPLLQTGAEIIVISAVVGMVYAALRPRPLQYTPWRPRGRALPAVLWPAPETAAASGTPAEAPAPRPVEPTAGVPFCGSCGRRFAADDERFCAACGAPRASG